MSASKYLKSFSPSSVNKFIEDKPGFYLERVMKFPFMANCSMERGSAVEAGIQELLMGSMDLPKAQDKALALYDAATRSLDIDDAISHRTHIPQIVEAGYEALKKYGTLLRSQVRVEFGQGWHGTALPWFGKADFEFEEVVIDLKITSKTPSELRPGYSRQGAFYHEGLRKPVIFTHVVCTPTGKISVVEKPVENIKQHLNVLTRAAIAMDTALKATPEQLEAMWFPDPGAWQNNDAGTAAKIGEVWRI